MRRCKGRKQKSFDVDDDNNNDEDDERMTMKIMKMLKPHSFNGSVLVQAILVMFKLNRNRYKHFLCDMCTPRSYEYNSISHHSQIDSILN